jgi:D-methionine transport system permease protein
MLGISLPLIILLGLIIGMIMYVTSSYYQKQSKITKAINQVLMVVVSMLRSIPFIILILAIIPITMALMGTFLG